MAAGPTFKAFTSRATGTVDRILTKIEVFPAFGPEAGPPPNGGVKTEALWDTGASKSVISQELAKALNLTPVGQANVNHAGGIGVSPTYLVAFWFPHHVGVSGILVTEFLGAPGGFGAIVGMDMICRGDFAITNVASQTCVSFRMPSCETIDYVSEANRLKYAGTGRNDPCPCGSGAKFKRCHGK